MRLDDPRLIESFDAENERDPFLEPVEEWDGKLPVRRQTMTDWLREWKIRDGECPRPGCNSALDEDGYCSKCGFSGGKTDEDVALKPDVAAEMFPAELFPDEYAPAQLTEEDAA